MEGHNRYLIYELLGRHVDVRLPIRQGGDEISGTVERVCRDIFGNVVEVTLNGVRHFFPEPQAIIGNDEQILFLYGDVDVPEDEERELFDDDFNGYEESINRYIERTSYHHVTSTVFEVGPVQKSPSRRWRTRSAVS